MKTFLLRMLLCSTLIFVFQIVTVKGQSSPNVGQPTQPPPTPGAISGPTSVGQGQIATYSIAAVSGATSYSWVL